MQAMQQGQRVEAQVRLGRLKEIGIKTHAATTDAANAAANGPNNLYMAIFEFSNCQHLALALMTLARQSLSLSVQASFRPSAWRSSASVCSQASMVIALALTLRLLAKPCFLLLACCVFSLNSDKFQQTLGQLKRRLFALS